MVPTAELRERVLSAAAATPSSTRSRARAASRVLVAASVACGVTIFEAIGGMEHSAGRPVHTTLTLAGGWTFVSAVLTWIVLGRGGSTMARAPIVVVLSALAAPVLVFVWMHLFEGTYVEPFQRVGYRCLSYTLLIAALPLGTFLTFKHAVEPRFPAGLGAAAGAACASWAGALINLWCPLTNTPHVLVGHVLPLVVAVLLGAAAGHYLLGTRGFT